MEKLIKTNIHDPIKSLVEKLSGSSSLEEEFRKLFLFFHKFNYDARFVGGCVRDLLLDTNICDIDMATDMPINLVLEKGKNEGFKIIPTGIKYGTVTFVLDNLNVQITSLRKDVSTDGRHAVVEYTNSWEEDSLRRDFSFNALYLDERGKIYDFHNGISDLQKGVINFIGNPNERIKEDYLRIFRYFRFWGKYASNQINNEVINQINNNLDGISCLSGERIRDELFKILNLENAKSVIDSMLYILSKVFKLHKNLLIPKSDFGYDINFIVLCCGFDNQDDFLYFLNRLKISKILAKKCKIVFKILKSNNSIKDFLCFSQEERCFILNIMKILDVQRYKKLNGINKNIFEDFKINGRDILAKFPNFPKEKISLEIVKVRKYWIMFKGKITYSDCLKILYQNICKSYNDCL